MAIGTEITMINVSNRMLPHHAETFSLRYWSSACGPCASHAMHVQPSHTSAMTPATAKEWPHDQWPAPGAGFSRGGSGSVLVTAVVVIDRSRSVRHLSSG